MLFFLIIELMHEIGISLTNSASNQILEHSNHAPFTTTPPGKKKMQVWDTWECQSQKLKVLEVL
jgi:hypothetical protein